MLNDVRMDDLLSYDKDTKTLLVNPDGRDVDIEASFFSYDMIYVVSGVTDAIEHIDIVNPVSLYGDASYLFAGNIGLFNDDGWYSDIISHNCTIDGCEKLDVSNVRYMSGMFRGLDNDTFNPDVSTWDVSNVENMDDMFHGCNGNEFNVDVSNWSTSSVIDLTSMFSGCNGKNFNPNVSGWDTSSFDTTYRMFYRCYGDSFNPDFSNWNFSSITNAQDMLYACVGGGFDVNKFITMCDEHESYVRAIELAGGTSDKQNAEVEYWDTIINNWNNGWQCPSFETRLLTKQNRPLHATVLGVDFNDRESGGHIEWEDTDGYASGKMDMSVDELHCRALLGYQFQPEIDISFGYYRTKVNEPEMKRFVFDEIEQWNSVDSSSSEIDGSPEIDF